MSDDQGTRVTCEDLDTGESQSAVIANDFLVITDGNRYLDGVQHYPGTGTTILTIKTRAES
ncbi:hypothetical protein [Terrabacter terrigena]|uniref:Uncharacterized protein n=1 Tax=Terrabacter terrigena TaxID=574718 RepID=A0ABW3N1A7_9MICO